MDIKSRSNSHWSIAVFICSFLFACAPSPRIFFQYGIEFGQAELAEVLAENPLGASENIKMTTLGYGQAVSHHIVQVGYLMMESRRIDLSVGDVVYIPRGIVHYYVNSASEPTVAFVTFSPPFDGKDYIPVTAP